MTITGWRIAAASVVGTSHLKQGTICQDNHACSLLTDCDGRTVMVLVAADGAGSASLGAAGSHLACDTFHQSVADYLAEGGRVARIDRCTAQSWLKCVQNVIGDCALEEGRVPRDYACTLLAAVVGEDAAASLQIGDGAIVVSDQPGEWAWVYWPQHGEFANITNFVTDKEAADRLDFGVAMQAVNEVALFTDGIERLVLHCATKTVHAPFFEKMFEPVRALENEGLDAGLCRGLERYLASPVVCERTDDDKTLILATRRLPGVADSETGAT